MRESMVDLSCITVNEIMSARLGILARVEYRRKMAERLSGNKFIA